MFDWLRGVERFTSCLKIEIDGIDAKLIRFLVEDPCNPICKDCPFLHFPSIVRQKHPKW